MRILRNSAAFVLVFILVVITYPIAVVVVGKAFVDGRLFGSFGWLSWPPIIFALVAFSVFFIAGAMLSWLIVSRRTIWWGLALGLAYTAIRAYFSGHSLTSAREPEGLFWLCLELVVPAFGGCLGAHLFRRHLAKPPK